VQKKSKRRIVESKSGAQVGSTAGEASRPSKRAKLEGGNVPSSLAVDGVANMSSPQDSNHNATPQNWISSSKVEPFVISPEIRNSMVDLLNVLETQLARRGTPKIYGKFDLYPTNIPVYISAYRPTRALTTHPEYLYLTILTHHPSINKIGSVNIPEQYIGGRGTFKSRLVSDVDGTLDIAVDKLKHMAHVELPYKPISTWLGPSVEARLTLEHAVGGGGVCGVKYALGGFKMRPLWKKLGEDGRLKELFEGSFSFEMGYENWMKKKGYEDVFQPGFTFWAVRGN
jgi:hypothetical protein